MGECGCGELQIINDVFDYGKEDVIIVETFTGCDYCNYGAGVSLYLMSKEDADDFGIESQGKFLRENPLYNGMKSFPLLDKDDLIDAAKKMLQETDPFLDELTYWLDENGRQLIQRAIRIRLEKTENETSTNN